MARYLPEEWQGKRVALQYLGEGGFRGTLVSESEGGIFLQVFQNQNARNLFIPWSSIRYLELLEEADKSPSMMRVRVCR